MSNSVQSQISCNDVVVIGTPISHLSPHSGPIDGNDYIVISKKCEDGKYMSQKYSFNDFDQNYVHKTGDEIIEGEKSFETIRSGFVNITNGNQAVSITGGKTNINGNVNLGEMTTTDLSGVLNNKGLINSEGHINIDGSVGIQNGSVISARMTDDDSVKVSFTSDSIKILKDDSKGKKNIIDFESDMASNNGTLSIGTDGDNGKKVDVYVPYPGNMSDLSGTNRAATTNYIHDNYQNIPECKIKYNYLSSLEKEHDDNTVHKTFEETIVGTKTLSSAHLIKTITQNDNIFVQVKNLNEIDIGKIITNADNDGNNSLTLQINKTGSDSITQRSQIVLSASDNGKTSITLDKHPENVKRDIQRDKDISKVGLDIATTGWARNELIELSDQTHDYKDIVNAPEQKYVLGDYEKAKLSPSVTAVKDFNSNVIIPQTDYQITQALSDYCAYEYDGNGDTEDGKKIHLMKMRLIRFDATYEGREDDDPVPFYVMTPLTTNNN